MWDAGLWAQQTFDNRGGRSIGDAAEVHFERGTLLLRNSGYYSPLSIPVPSGPAFVRVRLEPLALPLYSRSQVGGTLPSSFAGIPPLLNVSAYIQDGDVAHIHC